MRSLQVGAAISSVAVVTVPCGASAPAVAVSRVRGLGTPDDALCLRVWSSDRVQEQKRSHQHTKQAAVVYCAPHPAWFMETSPLALLLAASTSPDIDTDGLFESPTSACTGIRIGDEATGGTFVIGSVRDHIADAAALERCVGDAPPPHHANTAHYCVIRIEGTSLSLPPFLCVNAVSKQRSARHCQRWSLTATP